MAARTIVPTHCGLDFGTSNSTLGTCVDGVARLVPLEGEAVTAPSAVFFGAEPETHFLIARHAVETYVEGRPGRLLRSLKSVLGSSLIDEKTQVYKRRIAFADIIGLYVGALKRRAEQRLGHELRAVVHGRPVHFVDGDAVADAHAEATLRAIAREAGFAEVSFQLEPIAAAYDYETQIDRDEIALIADIGGGTSDFTVARLGPSFKGKADRASDILATGGIRLGGTDFDRQLSMTEVMPLFGHGSRQKRGDIDLPAGAFWDLSTWSSIHLLYDPKRLTEFKAIRHAAAEPRLFDRLMRVVEQRRGHDVLIAVEGAKVALSDAETHAIDLGWVEAGLAARATRSRFETATRRFDERLSESAHACVRAAGLSPRRIDAVFLTGGTSAIPSARRAILAGFDGARVVEGDRFGSVGKGLAIEAARRYG